MFPVRSASLGLLCVAAFLLVGSEARFDARKHVGAMNHRLHRPGMEVQDVTDGPPAQYFQQLLDHFDSSNSATFTHKFYVNDTFWNDVNSPVFFVLGGEGPVSNHYVTGHFHVNVLAESFGALVVALEHRFYGETIPGNDSSTANLRFLSSQQALADAAYFHHIISEQYNVAPSAKWVVFGGSYSGSLSAWARLKYPHLFHGAISASAPLKAELDFSQYFEVVAHSVGPACTAIISNAMNQVNDLLTSTAGRAKLQQSFQTCTPINNDNDVMMFVSALSDGVSGVVQYNDDNNSYQPMDVTAMCSMLTSQAAATDPMTALANFVIKTNNFSGASCTEVDYEEYISEMMPTSDSRSWVWQTCTEYGYYQTGEAADQPFSPLISLNSFLQQCVDIFKIPNMTPNVDWTNQFYGSTNIQTSNTVFTNGNVDPWHILGLTNGHTDDGNSIVYIHGTAHCADLYPDRASDLPGLTLARQVQAMAIAKWLAN